MFVYAKNARLSYIVKYVMNLKIWVKKRKIHYLVFLQVVLNHIWPHCTLQVFFILLNDILHQWYPVKQLRNGMTGGQLLHLYLKLHPLGQCIENPGKNPTHAASLVANPCENVCIPVKQQKGVILFVVKQLSLFSACDDTWCSFSWTTGMRVSSSVHWVSMRARSERSTTVSTFFRRSSWLPSVTTELFKLDFPSTSFENSWDEQRCAKISFWCYIWSSLHMTDYYYSENHYICFGWAPWTQSHRVLFIKGLNVILWFLFLSLFLSIHIQIHASKMHVFVYVYFWNCPWPAGIYLLNYLTWTVDIDIVTVSEVMI